MKKLGEEDAIQDGEISIENLEDIISGKPIEEITPDIKEKKEENIEEKAEAKRIAEEEKKKEDASFIGAVGDDEKKDDDETNKKKPAVVEEKEETSFYNKAKTFIESGFLEDIRIAITEDEEDEGVPLSEFKDLTEEQLNHIIETQEEKRKEDISSKYISRDNLSEHQLKVIDIMKNGGDINTLFESPEQIISRPFEDLDLNEKENQRKVVYHYYIRDKGLNKKEALLQLKQKEDDFELDSFSERVVGDYNKAYDKYLGDIKIKVTEEALIKKEDLSKVRKVFSSKLKEVKLKDSIIKKVVDGATKETSENRVLAQQRLDEILKNPEDNYQLLLHLLDEESYKELNKIKFKRDTTRNVLRIVDSIPKKTSKREKKVDDDSEHGLSDLEESISKIRIK